MCSIGGEVTVMGTKGKGSRSKWTFLSFVECINPPMRLLWADLVEPDVWFSLLSE